MNDIITLTNVPVITAGAYTSGDNIGGLIKFKGADLFSDGVGFLQSVMLADLAKQNTEIDLILFREKPASTTFTDDAELDIDDADLEKIIGIVTFDDWHSFKDNSIAAEGSLSIPWNLASSQIYAALVAREAPTFASTSDLLLRIVGYRQ